MPCAYPALMRVHLIHVFRLGSVLPSRSQYCANGLRRAALTISAIFGTDSFALVGRANSGSNMTM
jgi:hypothetical protein